MTLVYHVPECENVGCTESLLRLVQTLEKNGCQVAINKLNGRFDKRIQEQVDSCCCTILHKCEEFWKKLQFSGLDKYILDNADKVMTVKFVTSQQESLKRENLESDFENYFKQLYVLTISHDESVKHFVKQIKQTFAEQFVPNEAHGAQNLEKILAVPNGSSIEQSNHTFADGTRSIYDNTPRVTTSIFTKYEEMRTKEIKRSASEDNKWNQYPPVRRKKSQVMARIPNRKEMSHNILFFSSLKSFKDLNDGMRIIQKEREKLLANVYFLLHKVLPKLYDSNDASGVANIAVCCDIPVLQRKALMYLELLILKGHLINSQEDLVSLTAIQNLLTIYIIEIRHQSTSALSIIKRLCFIIIQIQMEKNFLCQTVADFDKSDKINKQIRLLLTQYQISTSVDSFIKMVDTVLQSPADKVQQAMKEILSQKQTDEYPYIRVNDFLGKKLSVQFAVTQHLIKKLFTSMDVRVLHFFEACINSKGGRFLKPTPLHPSLCAVLFIELIHFLAHGLRETLHINIDVLCQKVMDVLDLLSKQEISIEVVTAFQYLVFDSTPVIRQCVIKLLEKHNSYKQNLIPLLLLAIENLLAPLLYIDQEDKKALINPENVQGWSSISGCFGNTPVTVFFHRPLKEDHWKKNKTEFVHKQDDIACMNEIKVMKRFQNDNIMKLMAFHTQCLPQFYILEQLINLQEFLVNSNKNHSWCSLEELLEIVHQVLLAIKVCHDQRIVHGNITAASFFFADNNKRKVLKLGGFTLATEVKINSKKRLESTDHIPLRWSARETVMKAYISVLSDLYMVGVTMFEVLTYGLMPFSVECADDETFCKKLCEASITLTQQLCIDNRCYVLITKCTSHNPEERPTFDETISNLEQILRDYEPNSTHRLTFPDLKDGRYPESLGFRKGIPDIENFVDLVMPLDNHFKSLEMISKTTCLYQLDDSLVVREVIDHRFCSKSVKRIQKAVFIKNLQSILIHNIGKKQVIEMFLPFSCTSSLTSVLNNRELEISIASFVDIMLEVSELLKRCHDSYFVMGEISIEYMYISTFYYFIKICPISLAYFNINKASDDSSIENTLSFDKSDNIFKRSAPEVSKQGFFTTESDIYSFGKFAQSLLKRFQLDPAVFQYCNSSPNTATCPSEKVLKCIENCKALKPQDRPSASSLVSLFTEVKQQINPSPAECASHVVLNESIVSGTNSSFPSNTVVNPSTASDILDVSITRELHVVNSGQQNLNSEHETQLKQVYPSKLLLKSDERYKNLKFPARHVTVTEQNVYGTADNTYCNTADNAYNNVPLKLKQQVRTGTPEISMTGILMNEWANSIHQTEPKQLIPLHLPSPPSKESKNKLTTLLKNVKTFFTKDSSRSDEPNKAMEVARISEFIKSEDTENSGVYEDIDINVLNESLDVTESVKIEPLPSTLIPSNDNKDQIASNPSINQRIEANDDSHINKDTCDYNHPDIDPYTYIDPYSNEINKEDDAGDESNDTMNEASSAYLLQTSVGIPETLEQLYCNFAGGASCLPSSTVEDKEAECLDK